MRNASGSGNLSPAGRRAPAAAGTPQAEAEPWLQRALDVACRQEAKSLELRAAMSLGRLWQQQGKRAEAYKLLAPIYGWFTEALIRQTSRTPRRYSMSWRTQSSLKRVPQLRANLQHDLVRHEPGLWALFLGRTPTGGRGDTPSLGPGMPSPVRHARRRDHHDDPLSGLIGAPAPALRGAAGPAAPGQRRARGRLDLRLRPAAHSVRLRRPSPLG